MAHGVFQREVAGMQGDASVGVAAWSTVFQVAFYRAANLGQLAPYLVVASGVQVYFQKVVPLARGNEPVVQHRLLRPRHLPVVGTCRVVLLLTCQPMCECALWFLWAVLYYGPICFVYLVVLGKHFVQAWKGLARLGKKYHARYRSVQSVHHTQIYVTGFVVLLLQPIFDKIREGSVPGLIALDYLPCLFVNDYQMVVFV